MKDYMIVPVCLVVVFGILFLWGTYQGMVIDRDYWKGKASVDRTMLVKVVDGSYKPPRGFKFYGLGCCEEGNTEYLLYRSKNKEIKIRWLNGKVEVLDNSYFFHGE